jgi:hypothetical protein
LRTGIVLHQGSGAHQDDNFNSSIRKVDRLAFFALTFCGVGLIGLFTVFLNSMSWIEQTAVAAGAAMVFGMGIYWTHYYCTRLASWIAIGEDFRFQTSWRERQAPWSEVARFVVGEPGNPIPGISVINIMLTDGTKLALWARTAEADAALDLVRGKPWAHGWIGLPLERGRIIVTLLLGVLAFLTGLLAAYWLIRYYFGDIPFPRGFPFGIKFQIMAAIGGPLLGVGAIGFSVYHLIHCPIFYRGGVLRSFEEKSDGLWQRVRKLFWRAE